MADSAATASAVKHEIKVAVLLPGDRECGECELEGAYYCTTSEAFVRCTCDNKECCYFQRARHVLDTIATAKDFCSFNGWEFVNEVDSDDALEVNPNVGFCSEVTDLADDLSDEGVPLYIFLHILKGVNGCSDCSCFVHEYYFDGFSFSLGMVMGCGLLG